MRFLNHRTTVVNWGCLLFAVVWLVIIAQTLDPEIDDFKRYWQAARDLAQHGDPYRTRQDYFYPPLFAFLMFPLQLLDHEPAQRVWFGLNVLILAGFLILCIRISGSQLARRFWGVVVLGALIVPPTRLSLQLGQVSILVALVVVGCFVLAKRYPAIAGWLLAFISLVRINPAFLGIAYGLRPPRQVAWWAIGSGIVLVAISFVLHGFHPYQSYYQTIVHTNIQLQGAYPYAAEHNISCFGFWYRLLAPSNYAIPPVHSPSLARVASLLSTAVVLGICLWVGYQPSDPPDALRTLLTFGVWVCGMMLVWPTNGYYNLVILLLPVLAVIRLLEQQPDRTIQIWLVGATALLCIPPGWTNAIPSFYHTMHTGWWLLLLTPSFYGLCLWLGLLVYTARRCP